MESIMPTYTFLKLQMNPLEFRKLKEKERTDNVIKNIQEEKYELNSYFFYRSRKDIHMLTRRANQEMLGGYTELVLQYKLLEDNKVQFTGYCYDRGRREDKLTLHKFNTPIVVKVGEDDYLELLGNTDIEIESSKTNTVSAGGFFNKKKINSDENDENKEHAQLIKRVQQYIDDRIDEWDYRYNFLSIVAFVYGMLDFFLQTDYCNTKSKDAKLTAAMHLYQCLDSGELSKIEITDIESLQDERLSELANQCLDIVEKEGAQVVIKFK
jgi:hypothetical protein